MHRVCRERKFNHMFVLLGRVKLRTEQSAKLDAYEEQLKDSAPLEMLAFLSTYHHQTKARH